MNALIVHRIDSHGRVVVREAFIEEVSHEHGFEKSTRHTGQELGGVREGGVRNIDSSSFVYLNE